MCVCVCVCARMCVCIHEEYLGTSLAVQWLSLHLPKQGVCVRSLVSELRSCMPLGQRTKQKN